MFNMLKDEHLEHVDPGKDALTTGLDTAVQPLPAPACDPFDQGLPRPVVLRLLAGPGAFSKGDYALYLRSEWWQQVKGEALRLFGHACMLCSSPLGLQVHHRGREAYKWLFREIVTRHLTVLCDRCHRRHHEK